MPKFPVGQDIQSIALSHPIPGQSMTRKYRGDPWQQPPQFTDLDEALEYMFDKLTQPIYLQNLMHLFEMNASVESIARTLLFTGFTQGKWTPSLQMLLYKPVLILIAVLAHKAGYPNLPMVEPSNHGDYHKRQMDLHTLASQIKNDRNKSDSQFKLSIEPPAEKPAAQPARGFATRPNSNQEQ